MTRRGRGRGRGGQNQAGPNPLQSNVAQNASSNDFPALGAKSSSSNDFPALGAKSSGSNDFPALGAKNSGSNDFPALGAKNSGSNDFPALGAKSSYPTQSGVEKSASSNDIPPPKKNAAVDRNISKNPRAEVTVNQETKVDNLKMDTLTISPKNTPQQPTKPSKIEDSDVQKESGQQIDKIRSSCSNTVTSQSDIKVEFVKEKSVEKNNYVRVLNGEFPAKRGKGTLGRPIQLRTNHYQLALKSPLTIYQYDIQIEAKRQDRKRDDNIAKNKDLMKAMFLELKKQLPPVYNNKLIYNFSNNLYSLVEIPVGEKKTYLMRLDGDGFEITIKPINSIYIDPGKKDQLQTISLMDLMCTLSLNYTCVTINRSFFTKNCDALKLGFGTELWRGAFASVRPSECGFTWNVDVTNKVFETCVDVLELACNHYNCSPDQLKNKILNDKYDGSIGTSFLESYRGRKIRTQAGFKKRIMGFGGDSFTTFPIEQPNKPVRQISIKDYFKETYQINIRYPNLPCISINAKSIVPMEICKTELRQKKNLDPKETADIIRHTAINAEHRMNYIDNWVKSNKIANDPILKEYNVNLKLQMVNLTGRILSAPDIEYSSRQVVSSATIGTKGSWDHRNFRFAMPNNAQRWVVLNMARTYPDTIPKLTSELIRIGRIHGMRLEQPLDILSTGPRPRDRQIDQIFEQIARKYHSPQNRLDLVVVILSGTQAYKQIKTMGDIKFGIPTQIIDEKTANKMNPMTASNILLKINKKLFGNNFSLHQMGKLFIDYLKYLYGGKDDNLMIMGADVTHPSTNNPHDMTTNAESIAAVTGSLDKECCYYAARLYAQKTPKGQGYEMIHDLDKMVIDLILENQKKNKTFPKRIIFYRDGVSEGQFSLVLRHEINKIRSACQRISPGYKPAITFVIVQKRHHTRFIPTNPKDYHGRFSNIPPGTVVDNTVVTENMFDYFLCSHSGIQGTSKPCRYFVLHDENNFSTDQMQLLSHYLCHVYSRCSKSVSYPAPAYYSHLAAFRGRCYLRSIPAGLNRQAVTSYEIPLHPNMKNRMFYI